MSRLHEGQLRGSFNVSSGCGSKMIFPFVVFFFSSIKVCADFCDRRDGEWKPWRDPGLEPGGYGEGRVDVDVLAGAMSNPRGSLWLVSFDINRTDPAQWTDVSNVLPNPIGEATYQVPHLSLCHLEYPWSIFHASICFLQHYSLTPENVLFSDLSWIFPGAFSIRALPLALLLFQPCQRSAMVIRVVREPI